MEQPIKRPEKIKLTEINPYLTCYLCKGYFIDATTISECLHSFCRSCIIKFLQDNSYCPVCEVIINKAKPNLKLDKTLQDIVYKLVPELFLREMTRRKQYYQQYPQIAARVSPEERGDDTERTIFNPQDCISLSMEYISADSSPGAIKLFGWRNGSDKNGPLTPEENQALMKRYLQCPGMCRVEVLKKFVRNKYNVDTSLFHIDMLYKRVPLPDHYTLIDIAYIYSWKRNEPMKFFFRITDINKVSERFDYFNSQNPMDFVVKTPVRALRNNGDRTGSGKKRELKKKMNKQASPKKDVCDENKSEHNDSNESIEANRVTVDKSECDNIGNNDKNSEKKDCENKVSVDKVTVTTASECSSSSGIKIRDEQKSATYRTETDIVNIKTEKGVSKSDELNKSILNEIHTVSKEQVEVKSEGPSQVEIPGHLNTQTNGKGEIKKAVYTNITLNRTNNVEIITKIQKVSNKAGQAIGLNIIKQTVKNNTPAIKPTKKVSSCKKAPQAKTSKSASKSNVSKIQSKITSSASSANKSISIDTTNHDDASTSVSNLNNNDIKQKPESPAGSSNSEDVEKRRFLESIELTAKNVQSTPEQKIEPVPITNGHKRKLASPVKSESTVKKPKLDKKPTTRIILSKPKQNQQNITKSSSSSLQSRGLKSLIESCKIPSSLSITIKDSTENNRVPSLIPPVKNFIEILKLPDENGQPEKQGKECASTKLELNMKMCDNDSEQKVDEDLAQIAKSLTERIPMSTTISEIVGPKPQFPIPVKTNVPLKFIQPSPVPELTNKILNVTKDNKLNPRSPQTFQKIFEQSIKTPEEEGKTADKGGQKSALDLSNDSTGATNSKRNISDIASQLSKKTKSEQEVNISDSKSDECTTPKPAPKVPIPRLPNHRNLKPPQKNLKFELSDPMKFQQTLTNLHSNALGLNYTISVGHNVPLKTNGLVPTVKQELDNRQSSSPGNLEIRQNTFASPRDVSTSSPRPSPIPRNLSPAMSYNSPRNSPKHSPKSSPMIKHMYAPVPNLMMDQLRVNTYTQRVPSPKVNTFSKSPKSSPQLPSSSANLPSPSKHPIASPGSSPKILASSPKIPASSPKIPASSPKHLAASPKHLAASPKSLAASPKPLAASPKPSVSSPKTPASSPSPLVFSPKPPSASPKECSSPKMSPNAQASTSGLAVSSLGSPKQSSCDDQSSPLSPNQILEKYNIQNLAQLSASLNFNASNTFGMNPNNQLAAIQHAMLLKRFEMQNRQNWLNMNQGPLLQYEKYLQSLKNNHLLSNMKEN